MANKYLAMLDEQIKWHKNLAPAWGEIHNECAADWRALRDDLVRLVKAARMLHDYDSEVSSWTLDELKDGVAAAIAAWESEDGNATSF